ncbi:hypothetical protein [Hyphococcus sp.]|uniref:hypothetical protein n=1 Tax=Hyphococcus sp. TaxID=2038636 RepID=UPI003CCC2ECB
MTIYNNTTGLLKKLKVALIASGAIAALSAAPAAMAGDLNSIVVDSVNLDFGDEDFLQALIEMDADDIAEMSKEFADARDDIRDAITEIADARAEAEKSDQASSILAVALSEAGNSVSETAESAFAQVRAELNRAQEELTGMRSSISPEEYSETQEVISFLRAELSAFEDALGDLIAALNA